MRLTYYGHSCFLLEVNGKRLLFDPFIRPNSLAANINLKTLSADYMLISHGHEDHLADSIELAVQTGALVISNWEICQWLTKQGVQNTLPMNIGGKKIFDFGNLKCVTAVHSSSFSDGSYAGNPMGFVIKSDKTVYYAGDTALTMDMQLVAQGSPVDVCILPIGDHFTMGFEDAAKAAHLIQCRDIVGVHYNTFPYIEIDTAMVKEHFKKNGLHLLLPSVGETIDL
jgi:L-ascorbate metabolism protein UlaG (beta-lactamase superfamily)